MRFTPVAVVVPAVRRMSALVPAVFAATMLWVSVSVPPLWRIAPPPSPELAVFPARVQWVRVAVPAFIKMAPPPAVVAVLPEKVQCVSERVLPAVLW